MRALAFACALLCASGAAAQDLPPLVLCHPHGDAGFFDSETYFVPVLNFIVWPTAMKAPFVPLSDKDARRIAPTDEIVFAGRVFGEPIGKSGQLEFAIVEIAPGKLKLFLEDKLGVGIGGMEVDIIRGIETRDCEWRETLAQPEPNP